MFERNQFEILNRKTNLFSYKTMLIIISVAQVVNASDIRENDVNQIYLVKLIESESVRLHSVPRKLKP